MVKEKYEKGEKKPDTKRETWDSLKDEGNKLFSHRKYEQGMESIKRNIFQILQIVLKIKKLRNIALKAYSRAIQKAPTNDVLFTNRALCRIKLKKFDDACGDAREAIQHCPNRFFLTF